ncbi:hypothetical protein LCGC14_0289520 [marine sediment metagenome]|uniref:Uncharacterized protein n=1 Tax=marine sediment metagenome TaxID=412755 RepID=A0A0F9TTW5_9ZZZZ
MKGQDLHGGCAHGTANAWTQEPTRRYFKRCDTCDTFRPWASYYEVYYADVDREETCWWWECTKCLIKTVSDYAEVWELEDPPAEMGATEIMEAEAARSAADTLKQLATALENSGEKEIAARVRVAEAEAEEKERRKWADFDVELAERNYDLPPNTTCPGCGVEIDLQEEGWRRDDGPCMDGNYWCINPFNDGQCCGCVPNDENERAERAEAAHRDLIRATDEDGWEPIGTHEHPQLESEPDD